MNLLKVWDFFNGKKTNLAAGCMIAATFLSQVVVGIWGFNPEWVMPTIKTLEWSGASLGIIGLGDKFRKGKLNITTTTNE